MPDCRARKSSMADLMAKVSVNKGSLLSGIENLLKTIESSESAVMIPTLLRDKCEFDAWELLFVAKILKASILGHSDLVEFYMNHISHQKNLVTAVTPPAATLRQASSPALSPATSHLNHNGHLNQNGQTNGHSPSLSSASSVSSQTSSTATTTTAPSSTSTGWMTASSQQQQQPQQPQQSNRSASSSLSSASTISSITALTNTNGSEADIELAVLARSLSIPSSVPAATASPVARQAQPPSLLQLTTNNNHINSKGAVTSLTASGAIEQLASSTVQLISNGGQPTLATTSIPNNGFDLGPGALSISTTTANQQSTTPTTPTTPTASAGIVHHELKSSRSAGCLFRNNQSGASSPRTPYQSTTPTTPCLPQAETLANGPEAQLAAGDPSMPVKLLLQIEQLKTSIVYVTNLLENVVELYKKSIDNIA